LAATVLSGVLCGCAPAWQISSKNLSGALKEGGRSTSGAGRHGLRRTLVVVEFALALTLLAGAGLVIHSFWKLMRVDLGFHQDHVLTFTLPPRVDRFSQPEQITVFYRQLLDRIAAVPGVSSVAASTGAPIVGTSWGMDFSIAGQPPADESSKPSAGFTMVTPDYFRVFGMRIVQGRGFTNQDAASSLPVAIVNETFVRQFLSNVDPLSQRVVVQKLNLTSLGPPIDWQIVGIYHDVHNRGVRREGFPEIIVPLWQSPLPVIRIEARTIGDPTTMTASIAAAIHSLDSDLALDQVRTMDQLVDESLAGDRFVTLLFAGFAGVALVLAAIGIYGVMSFAVAQRTHEIGLRMALGAGPGQVLRLILQEGMLLACVGLLLGLGGSYFVGRTMKSILYEVAAIDPVAIGAVSVVLFLSALLACYLPARRAMRVDPMVALRYE
jgi:putative ABC transport system permease protein